MKNIAIIYWSGTGNTEAMASAIAESAKQNGVAVSAYAAEDFSAEQLADFDAFAFGCPSMGDEELEDTIFEPLFSACEKHIGSKPLALFGSYGWGDGEWMRNWEARCRENGLSLIGNGVICCEAPDDEAKSALVELGKKLAD